MYEYVSGTRYYFLLLPVVCFVSTATPGSNLARYGLLDRFRDRRIHIRRGELGARVQGQLHHDEVRGALLQDGPRQRRHHGSLKHAVCDPEGAAAALRRHGATSAAVVGFASKKAVLLRRRRQRGVAQG